MNHKTTYPLPVVYPQGTDTEMLQRLQHETFAYFIDKKLCRNGLVADKTQDGSPSSIAVVGFALSSYIIGVERGYITRADAIHRTLSILRFLYNSHQGPEPDATGYKGFYYHFLDMDTGKRTWECELSTIDTAILMAGILTATNYYLHDSTDEADIRRLGDKLYRRVDWQWALNNGTTLTHGWRPETGFLKSRWDSGYSEAHILYILALGAPEHPIDKSGYLDWTKTFEWKNIYDTEFIYAGPLFIHQMSHMWLDFRGIYDNVNRQNGIDYFENSQRAIHIQRAYAIHNPLAYDRYGKYSWGLSASDGPGPCTYVVNGTEMFFDNYTARGVPYGPDDGTISPWAIVASLPFAPDVVLDTLRHIIERLNLIKRDNHGFHASFNATFPDKGEHPYGWVSPWQFGLNQGSVVIAIENYWSGLVWNLFQKCPYVVNGLKKAGFTDGWLENQKD